MQLSAGGDARAFEQLYDRYFEKLVWFARSFTKDRVKAEDVVQDVFTRIIEDPHKFDVSQRFSTWVYTVTANQCRNLIRNEENRQRILRETNVMPQEARVVQLVEPMDRKGFENDVRRAVSTLSDKEQTIYSLRFEEQLSIKEIAAVISIPEGSVKSGIFHLLKKISKHLKHYIHEEQQQSRT